MALFSGFTNFLDPAGTFAGGGSPRINALTGVTGAEAAMKASNAQERSAQAAVAEQRYEFEKSLEATAPWREAGANALQVYQNALFGAATPQGYNAFTKTPAYQLPLAEGTKAVERSAAARGNLLSGRTLKELTRFGQDYAGTQYGNYLGNLSNLSGLGYTGSAQTGQNALATGQNIGNLLTGAGNARASGYLNAAQAQQQGASNVASIAGLVAALFLA